MAWKYLNPGDYRLLNKYTATKVKNHIDSGGMAAPVTKRVFSLNENVAEPIVIPTSQDVYELWGAYTVFSSFDGRVFWHLGQSSSYVAIDITSSYVELQYYVSKATSLKKVEFTESPHLFRVWFHIKSSSSDGVIEVYINNELFYQQFGSNVLKESNIKVYRISSNTYGLLSDIILSDEPIDLNEHCYFLPVKQTIAEGWYYDDVNANYKTDAAGNSIWQIPDVAQLQKELGLVNPTITSIASQARNVSINDANVVDTLKLQFRQGSDVVETWKVSNPNGLFAPSAVSVNPFTHNAWTLDDLNNIEIGITSAKS